MISEAYGHKHTDTTIKYLNIVDDQLMEASDQYYAKHSVLYDVGRTPQEVKDMPAYQLYVYEEQEKRKHWNKESVNRWMPVQR